MNPSNSAKIGYVLGVLKALRAMYPEHEISIDQAIEHLNDIWDELYITEEE